MADIHVETKKHNTTPVWVWILVTLAVLALAAYFLTRNTRENENTGVNNSNPTSYIPNTHNAVYFIG